MNESTKKNILSNNFNKFLMSRRACNCNFKLLYLSIKYSIKMSFVYFQYACIAGKVIKQGTRFADEFGIIFLRRSISCQHQEQQGALHKYKYYFTFSQLGYPEYRSIGVREYQSPGVPESRSPGVPKNAVIFPRGFGSFILFYFLLCLVNRLRLNYVYYLFRKLACIFEYKLLNPRSQLRYLHYGRSARQSRYVVALT